MWTKLTWTDVLTRLSPQEQAALSNIQSALPAQPTYLSDAVAEAIGAIRAGGYPYNTDGTTPDQLKNQILAIALWTWLGSFPQLKALQTPERRQAASDAREILGQIAGQKCNVEPPTPGVNPASGQWNSENKLIMRTHPVPPPGTQFQSSDPGDQPEYANPSAPPDQQQTNPQP